MRIYFIFPAYTNIKICLVQIKKLSGDCVSYCPFTHNPLDENKDLYKHKNGGRPDTFGNKSRKRGTEGYLYSVCCHQMGYQTLIQI